MVEGNHLTLQVAEGLNLVFDLAVAEWGTFCSDVQDHE